MEIIYVIPDYYSKYPKPCMDGWARRQFTVAPNGDVLPCPAAQELVRGLDLPRASVREHALEWIWAESPLFKRFRGDGLDAGSVPQLRPSRASTSAAAVARPSRSPATPPAPTRSATSPPTTSWSRRRWRRPTTRRGRVAS